MLGHVAVQVVAATLGMAHLAQDAAVGARDALDGECGAVGVDGEIHAGLAVLAHVLRGDLAVGDQLGEHFVIGDKAALAVADGDGVGSSRLHCDSHGDRLDEMRVRTRRL